MDMKEWISNRFPEAYQANTPSKSSRKRIQDSHGWIKPTCQPFVGSLGLMDTLDLLMNEGENGAGRVAVLELGNKWMREKIVLCALFVGVQGIVKD